MTGLEGRCNLLIKLGDALAARPDLCATGRPGDLLSKSTLILACQTEVDNPVIEYFEPKVKDSLPLSDFWSTLFDLLLPIWPSRVTLPSHPTYPLGDVWPCTSLSRSLDQAGIDREEGDDFVPFHKLTQWLCYSLVDAIESEAGWKVDKGLGQTGLPEVSTRLSFAFFLQD